MLPAQSWFNSALKNCNCVLLPYSWDDMPRMKIHTLDTQEEACTHEVPLLDKGHAAEAERPCGVVLALSLSLWPRPLPPQPPCHNCTEYKPQFSPRLNVCLLCLFPVATKCCAAKQLNRNFCYWTGCLATRGRIWTTEVTNRKAGQGVSLCAGSVPKAISAVPGE